MKTKTTKRKKQVRNSSNKSAPPQNRVIKSKNSSKKPSFLLLIPTSVLIALSIIFSIFIGYAVHNGCGLTQCIKSIQQDLVGDTTIKKSSTLPNLNNWQGFNTTRPRVSVETMIQLHGDKAYLMVKNGIKPAYQGSLWWLVQPIGYWQTTQLESLTAKTNTTGILHPKQGKPVPFQLLNLQSIGPEEPFGTAGQYALQACADRGKTAGQLLAYHQKPFEPHTENPIYLIANGYECGFELSRAGLAIPTNKDTTKGRGITYQQGSNLAKQAKIGLFSPM